MSELNNCPFCGGKGKTEYSSANRPPAREGLVAMDEDKITKLLQDNIESMITIETPKDCIEIAQEICKKYGTKQEIKPVAYPEKKTFDISRGDYETLSYQNGYNDAIDQFKKLNGDYV